MRPPSCLDRQPTPPRWVFLAPLHFVWPLQAAGEPRPDEPMPSEPSRANRRLHDSAAARLGVSLNTDAKSLNNTVKLLSLLRPGHDAGATRSAIIALERFFSERLCRGDLRATSAGTNGRTDGDAGASLAKYREWFQKHYKLFTKRLCHMLAGTGFGASGATEPAAGGAVVGGEGGIGNGSRVAAKTQVLALAALMECARSEHPGRFNNELYAAALTAALRGNAFTPELMGALATRYLVKMDVRYHTYATVLKIANEIRSGDGARAASRDEGGDDGAEENDGAGEGNARISAADLSRNLYDVLSRTPPVFGDYKPPTGGGISSAAGMGGGDDDDMDFEAMLGLMKGDGGDGENGAGEDEGECGAWCKAMAVGESAAKEAVAAKKGKAGGKKAQAAATAAADKARKEADKAAAKWQDGKRHRKLFAEAWLAFLRTPFPSDIYRKVLTKMHSSVMPHMPNPLLLSDFCTASIDRGGLDGMLALNGIFVLMTQHSLEYPQFYNRLYQLLDASAFHVNNRKGFFELLDIFMRSPALPAYLAAAFIKRLARLSLTAPPSGAMTCIAFVHNLLRRHPGCSVLVHREGKGGEKAALVTVDPFRADEPDPARCKALDSSLWEMETLKSHYFPQVSKFVQVLDKDLTDRVKTAEIPMGDICMSSYASLMSEELQARVKTAPLAVHRGGYDGLFATPLMKECFGGSFEWR